MRRFVNVFRPTSLTTILDVGGYPKNWEANPVDAAITVANVHTPDLPKSELTRWNFTLADGRRLPFGDSSFDIAYSNSVIEHLSTQQDQAAFASEMRRVGKRLWVQTPAKTFPVEPHLVTPLVHFLPKSVQRKVLPFTVWGLIAKPSREEREAFLREVRLLSYGEMKRLFPDCRIERERFALFTKSYIAVR